MTCYIETLRNIRWQINFSSASFFVLFVVLFMCLGVWQLDRASTKQYWIEQKSVGLTAEPTMVEFLNKFEGQEYERIALRGQFDQQAYWWLQNQIVEGKVGQDLLVPFITLSGDAVLVNLGWVTADTVDQIPEFNSRTITLNGFYRKPFDMPFVSNIFVTDQPSVVEIKPADFPYNDMVSDWYVQIDPAQPEALKTHWQTSTVSPAKHYGYALQWFVMAAVLAFAFVLTHSNLPALWTALKNKKS